MVQPRRLPRSDRAAASTATAHPLPHLMPAKPFAPQQLRADVLVVGASFGGVAAALAAAQLGRTVLLTEETSWIGGQATGQGVPLDEHPWIEQFGAPRSYRQFRAGVRAYYRRHYPLSPAARADPLLNPGAAWVTALAYEPRVGQAVLYELLAPHLAAGRVRLLLRHRPVAVAAHGDRIAAVTLRDETSGHTLVANAPFVLDATELGDVLELGGVEHVVGAEAQAETGEPNALPGPADPRDQMGFTHVCAFDWRPGEDHTIPRPADYEHWCNRSTPKFRVPDLFGHTHDHFGQPVRPGRYIASTWSFRRLLCRGNFADGALSSDITVPIWGGNEYHDGVLLGVSPEEQRRAFTAARQLTLCLVHWLQTAAPNPATGGHGYPGLRLRPDVFDTPDALAPYPYIRESRRIRAELTVTELPFRTDVPGQEQGPVKFPDSVGLGGYRVDIHKPAKRGPGSMTTANHGKHWCQQVPLGALLPVRVENLLPACKNLGVTSVMNGAFRLHPVEWTIGEAAGALAAFCLERKLAARQVRHTPTHLADYQRLLVRLGGELDWPGPLVSRSYYSHHTHHLHDADSYYFGEAWRL